MKSGFSSINFHTNTVERFKGFCQKTGATYTDTLEHMMDFFDRYQLSPLTDFGPNIRGMETNIKKRINALVAIIKDIEKHQIKPTASMMQLLFEQAPPKEEQEDLIEITAEEVPQEHDYYNSLEGIELRKEKNQLKRDLENAKKQFDDLLFSKVRETKSSFGKPKLYLDLTPEEFKALEEKFKNE